MDTPDNNEAYRRRREFFGANEPAHGTPEHRWLYGDAASEKNTHRGENIREGSMFDTVARNRAAADSRAVSFSEFPLANTEETGWGVGDMSVGTPARTLLDRALDRFRATPLAVRAGAGILVISSVLAVATDDGTTAKDREVAAAIADSSAEKASSESKIFENKQVAKLANSLSINEDTYFRLTKETVEEVSKSGLFARNQELAPVFFPTIQKQKDIIVAAAQKHDVPPNVFATLASIESAGIVDARSGADAYGLVQVVPRYHFDKFAPYLPDDASLEDYYQAREGNDSDVSLDEYKSVFTDPQINASAGAEYFAECIDAARKSNPDLDPNSIIIYARAAAAYNGGPSRAGSDYADMPLESQLYVNHVSRILLDAELSLRLKAAGMSDKDILKNLSSDEMDARSYAYQEIDRNGTLGAYESSADQVINMKDNPDVAADYKAYKDDPIWKAPLSPGIRIWFAGGGKGLYVQSSENVDWKAE